MVGDAPVIRSDHKLRRSVRAKRIGRVSEKFADQLSWHSGRIAPRHSVVSLNMRKYIELLTDLVAVFGICTFDYLSLTVETLSLTDKTEMASSRP
jgi:hypothetical protein